MIVSMQEYTRLTNAGRVMLTEEDEDLVLNLAQKIARNRLRRVSIHCVADLKSYLRNVYYGSPNEMFGILWLDTKHNVIEFDQSLFNGTIDGAAVYPRVVVREALRHNASACFLTHNHPSGSSIPSQADIALTRRLKESLALIDVQVLDHMVCGAEDVTSLAERGLM
jgi:DNA repair protein RadC